MIAFAAYKGPKTTENFNQIFRQRVVSEESVVQWLGHARCVLLIDELNNLESLASRSMESEAFANFLKDNFLKVAGRYFVFTTHEVFITGQLVVHANGFQEQSTICLRCSAIDSIPCCGTKCIWL